MCSGRKIYFTCPEAKKRDPRCPWSVYQRNGIMAYATLWQDSSFICCGNCRSDCFDCPDFRLIKHEVPTVECPTCEPRVTQEREAARQAQIQAHAQALAQAQAKAIVEEINTGLLEPSTLTQKPPRTPVRRLTRKEEDALIDEQLAEIWAQIDRESQFQPKNSPRPKNNNNVLIDEQLAAIWAEIDRESQPEPDNNPQSENNNTVTR